MAARKRKMPDAESAYVEEQKIRGYLLCTDHPDGRAKAAFFVTTLSAKADSFSGRACGNPLRCVPRAEPPPEIQYVASGVHVPVCGVATAFSFAAMHPIPERLFDLRRSTTRATDLRGIARINRDDSHTSFFRFMREDVDELRPASVVLGLRKPRSGDARDVQGFVSNQTMRVHQLTSFLVVEIPPLVSRLLVQFRNVSASLAASGRAFLLARQGALRPPELLLSLAVVARRLYRRAIRSDEEALESEVYTDLRPAGARLGRIPEIAGEDHVPLPARVANRDGLDRALDRTVLLDLYMPDIPPGR